MYSRHCYLNRTTILVLLILFCGGAGVAQRATGTLRGQVTDQTGAVVVGATITAIDATPTAQGAKETAGGTGNTKTSQTDDEGRYTISGLTPGIYVVRAEAQGFAAFENPQVEIAAGEREILDITLGVSVQQQEVTVAGEAPLSTEPANNADALVLRGNDLDALPDDPDDLAAALQALAGPSAGPNGGQLFIDGFTGGRLPPKESIREIRINQNPFAAEFDRLGFGRVEIFTKPGTDKLRGQGFFNFGDESLNSRNPFAPRRAPYQLRRFGGNLSGPIVAKKASFFLDFERGETDFDSVITASILDPSLNIISFNQALTVPRRRTTFSPRFDYSINPNNTFIGRYTFSRNTSDNAGIGGFNLFSRAFNSENTEQTFQLTETAVIGQSVNESRFQYIRNRRAQESTSTEPTLIVRDAFVGGGAQVGLSFADDDRFEFQNYTSFTLGRHSLKAGGRIRYVGIADSSPQNFQGTFTFSGGVLPQLDANLQRVANANFNPANPLSNPFLVEQVTSIEQFRRTQLLVRQGLTPQQVAALGYGATQFSINTGDPLASVSQTDAGLFVQDDYRFNQTLTLSVGLRYELQNNIDSSLNFAPRLSFAYSPGARGGGRPKTVFRGGFGIFYDRFNEDYTLQARRFGGTSEIAQRQFIVRNPTFFPNIPTTTDGFAAQTLTTRRVADDLQTPYTIQSSVSVERQLPFAITLTGVYVNTRTLHALRTRNINAPLSGTISTDAQGRLVSAVRPFGDAAGNIYQIESSGRFNQNQLIIRANNRFNRRLTLFANYVLSKASGDADGSGFFGGFGGGGSVGLPPFPANSFDLSSENGRSSFDVRHRFFFGGSFGAPLGVRFDPFINISSGRPFNITTGRDTNFDSVFTERPGFVTDLSEPGIVVTRFGAFDPTPEPGDTIIPRNYAEGPGFFSVNIRVGKTFNFGEVARGANRAASNGSGRQGGNAGGGGSILGGGGRRGSIGGGGLLGGAAEKRYALTLSVQFQNLLNRVNLGVPSGNLVSPFFGQSTTTFNSFGFGGDATGGNRSIQAQLRFSF